MQEDSLGILFKMANVDVIPICTGGKELMHNPVFSVQALPFRPNI